MKRPNEITISRTKDGWAVICPSGNRFFFDYEKMLDFVVEWLKEK